MHGKITLDAAQLGNSVGQQSGDQLHREYVPFGCAFTIAPEVLVSVNGVKVRGHPDYSVAAVDVDETGFWLEARTGDGCGLLALLVTWFVLTLSAEEAATLREVRQAFAVIAPVAGSA
jgi:hypothetical protein